MTNGSALRAAVVFYEVLPMAVARSRSSLNEDVATTPKLVERAKVLATDVDVDKAAAKKCVVKKTPTRTKVAKKAALKKTKSAPKKTAAVEPTTTPLTIEPEAAPAPATRRKIAKVWYEPRDPRPGRLSATDRLDLPPPASGAELIERVSWAIERELNQIEMIVGGHRLKPLQRTEAERRARTLASLARTLAVITQLRAKNLQSVADAADHDAMPRDLDEFRETLARRLEQLFAERPEPADGEPDAG